jgi:hypothetical protein
MCLFLFLPFPKTQIRGIHLIRPVKTEKAAKSAAYKANMMRAVEPEKPVILLPGAPQKPGTLLVIGMGLGLDLVFFFLFVSALSLSWT